MTAPSYRWIDYRSPDLAPPEDMVVILPVGSTEQHGRHMPVGTDIHLAEAVALEAAAQATIPVRVLPPVWISLAEHHMDRPGTLTLDMATLDALITGIAKALDRQKVKRLLLLNSHGGNRNALPVIADKLTRDLTMNVAYSTYWETAMAELSPLLEGQKMLHHACEAETSMILHLKPETVAMEKLADADVPATVPPQGLHLWRPFSAMTESGAYGRPDLASADKGAKMIETAGKVVGAKLSDPANWRY
ncbi:creatininase family protein [Pseudooceanicola sp. 502str34]